MGVIVNAIVSVTYGLQANLPTTAAEIASALNVPVGSVIPGMAFFCTDTDKLYIWDGTQMALVGVSAGSVTVADLASVEGNGSKIQLTSQGTTTSGDVVTYDGSGNVQDSKTLLSSLATTSALSTETGRAEAAEALLAPLASPTFSGTVTIPSTLKTTSNVFEVTNNAYVFFAGANYTAYTNGQTGTAAMGYEFESHVFQLTANDAFGWIPGTSYSADNPDTSLSRTAAGTVAIGNGTAGDYTGSIQCNNISEVNGTAATSSVSQSSPTLTFSGQYWNGSASATDSWTIKDVIGNGTNPTSILTFTHTGTTGTAAISFGNISRIGTNNVWLCTTANVNGVTTAQAINIQASGWGVALSGNSGTGNSVSLGNQLNITATSGTVSSVYIGGDTGTGTCRNTFAPTSGSANYVGLQVAPTIHQTGGANGNYTGILVNPTETAFGGTSAKLLDLQVGGSERFYIDNNGAMFLQAASAAPTSAGTAGTAGQIIYYGGNLYFCSVTGAAGSATWNKLSMTAV